MKDYKTTAKPKATADGIPVFCAHDEICDVAKLIPNPKNPNQHPDNQIQLLGRIIRQTGWRQPITVSRRSGFIVKGHGRLKAALLEGFKEAPVDYQDYASEAEEYADLMADNRIAELAETDNKMLADLFADIDTGEIPTELTGYTEEEMESLVNALSEALHSDVRDPDAIPDTPEPSQVVTQKGDLWILGEHRVFCGNCTDENDMAKLLDGAKPEILLTDPPYCSGGFQESGRAKGSIGTDAKRGEGGGQKVTIANDTLSTRGFQNLLKNTINLFPGTVLYLFTDWRMWIYLYDTAEACGYGVRSMLVWDKQTPGMGIGWRTQHELIMFAHRTKPQWDKHKGYSNILQCSRTGNELHPTQKPVELIEKLLDNTSWAKGVLDPFGGSGTTLIAAEKLGQQAWLMELEPKYVDVIVRRWADATGKSGQVKLIRKGKEVPRDKYEQIFG